MRQKKCACGALLLAALLICGGAAAQLADRLRICAGCHGEGGNSTIAGIPSLAGQPRSFTELQLFLFREGVRPQEPKGTLMRGVSDKEIAALAEHYAAQQPLPVAAATDAALYRQGGEIAAPCGACHLPDFRGRAQMPRLAGQREDYLYETMRAYRDNRRVGADTMMSSVLYGVPDSDIRAMAHYLSRLR